MKLYLVQHGNALSKDVNPDRPLSDRGRADVLKVADFLRNLNLSLGAIWHSGKTRAKQTAELLASAVKTEKGPVQHPGLAPNDDVRPVEKEVTSSDADLMVVGHLPFLSRLASLLLTDNQTGEPVAFRQGGVVCLSLSEDGSRRIEWMVVPDLLR